MKIWLVPSLFHPHIGGVEEVARQLGQRLGGRGHEITVITNRHPPSLPALSVVDGVQVVRIRFAAPSRSWRSWVPAAGDMMRSYRELARLNRPDVVNIHCAS